MSDEATQKVFEALKKKYPNLTDEAIKDIMETGANEGIITVEPAPGTQETKSGEEAPEFDVIKLLREGKGGDLSDVMQLMIVDEWMRQRFGKGKEREIPPEIKELLEKYRSGQKESDLDKLMDRMMKYEMMMSFMEGRKGRAQPQQAAEDTLKGLRADINAMGDKMLDALRTHKLEDEKQKETERAEAERKRADELEKRIRERERTEEDDRRLDERVREKTAPLEEKYNSLIKEIGKRIKEVPEEERDRLKLDLGSMITEELGETIKDRVSESIKQIFTPREESAVTVAPDGKPQMDLYKLGERGLKLLERFIDRIPTQAPGRKEVREIQKPPQLPPSPGGPPASTIQTKKEEDKPIILEKGKTEGTVEKSASEQAVTGECSEESRETTAEQKT